MRRPDKTMEWKAMHCMSGSGHGEKNWTRANLVCTASPTLLARADEVIK
jgi:hypothetical protein